MIMVHMGTSVDPGGVLFCTMPSFAWINNLALRVSRSGWHQLLGNALKQKTQDIKTWNQI